MAKTPERAMELMEAVWKPAVARVREEVTDMQAIADKERARITIAPLDYQFYSEKVRKAKYDLDQNEIKPYFQLEKLREGMFFVARELYGFRFTQITDGSVPVYHPDVRVWRVDDASGKRVGLWFFDPYARPGKRSCAWMNAYRPQSRFDGEVTTIVSNNANFIKGKPGEPRKRIAVVALARKLACVLWAMWRDGTVYDRATHATASAVGARREARKQAHRADALQTSRARPSAPTPAR
jgi:peptidyl-dipeptidase Dcp